MTIPSAFEHLPSSKLPTMTADAVAKVRALEAVTREMPQVEVPTFHVLHAGVYSRTILIRKDVLLTGALIKIPTTLTICGDVTVYVGHEVKNICGYHVIPGEAGRKQVFAAHEDTWLTMSFATSAKTVAEAEAEFTDEHEGLLSRKQPEQEHTINKEALCLEQ